jgi:hypothetical protein
VNTTLFWITVQRRTGQSIAEQELSFFRNSINFLNYWNPGNDDGIIDINICQKPGKECNLNLYPEFIYDTSGFLIKKRALVVQLNVV